MSRLTLGLLLAVLAAGSRAAGGTGVVPPATATAAPAHAAAAWRMSRGLYFKRNWGVEIIGVKVASSGYMLTFRYRVLDPDKAQLLNDRRNRAYLIDEATGIRLAVPALENIGELRTGSAPEADRNYYMVFGNPGKLVKTGSRVTVVAGNFRAEGIVVD